MKGWVTQAMLASKHLLVLHNADCHLIKDPRAMLYVDLKWPKLEARTAKLCPLCHSTQPQVQRYHTHMKCVRCSNKVPLAEWKLYPGTGDRNVAMCRECRLPRLFVPHGGGL
jgi:hypothetical protein